MFKFGLAGVLSIILWVLSPVAAQAYCTSYPNNLTNGTPANATEVMGNFGCAALTSGSTIESLTSTSGEYFTHGTDTFVNYDNTLGLHSGHFLLLQGDSSGGLWLAGTSSRNDNIVIRNSAHDIEFNTNGNSTPNLALTSASPAESVLISGAARFLNRSDSFVGYDSTLGLHSNQYVYLQGASGAGLWLSDSHDRYESIVMNTSTHSIAFYTSASTSNPGLAIVSSGNVGVGTASPIEKLYVSGNIHATGNITCGGTCGGSGGGYWTLSGSSLTVSSTSYNVGIGTASPSSKLDVYGTTAGTTAHIDNSASGGFLFFSKGATGLLGVGGSGAWLNDTSTDAAIAAYSPNIRIYTNGSSTERVRIDASGNVGVGTASPTEKLYVSGNIYATGNITCGGTCGGGGSGYWSLSGSSLTASSTSYNIGIGTATPTAKLDVNGAAKITGSLNVTGAVTCGSGCSSGPWSISGSAIVPSSTSYNVGIGTSSPQAALNVTNNVNWSGGWRNSLRIDSGSGDYPNIRLFSTASNKTSMIGNNGDGGLWFGINGSGDNFGSFGMVVLPSGNVGVGTVAPQAALNVTNNTNWSGGWRNTLRIDSGSGDYPNIRLFSTAANKTSLIGNNGDGGLWFAINGTGDAAGSYGMVILPGGNVGVGTVSPSYTLHVNGSVAGTSAYNNLSDVRLKKDVTPVEEGLSILGQLQPVRFFWKGPGERAVGKELNLATGERQIGFIAQDVRRVLPEAVSVADDKDAIMSVAESKLVPVLVAAMKQLKAANDNQAVEIAQLKSAVLGLQRKAGVQSARNIAEFSH
jgi:hypothetical protein